ncbi:MAG TPA: DUF1573 domain-containing protein [Firmicutes bacterium]|nr:DUF1573 domain-containing protein [Bacillota bacterium]
MKDLLCDGFQETVSECLVRHRSILDVITKLQEATARVNRAVAKSVTSCGCIKINASRQRFPCEICMEQLKSHLGTHIEGELCDQCRDVLETEIGSMLFYLAALCNLLDLNLYDIILKEQEKSALLGVYKLC